MAPAKCTVPKPSSVMTAEVVASLQKDATNKKEPETRANAAKKIGELATKSGAQEEPFMIELLEVAITLAGDNKSKDVREAADPAVDAILSKLSPFAIRACQKAIFAGFASPFWQSKMAALRVIDFFVGAAPKSVAAALPELVPEIAQVMVDMRDEVKEKSSDTMAKAASTIGNLDIEPFVPTLIECIVKIDEVPECVHKLAATTFVQQVESPTLSILGPLLMRGLSHSQMTAIKRKSAVIIDNMCKLVEDPMDAKPFVPKLLPLLKRAMDEVADPECRTVCTRAYKTLLNAAGEPKMPLLTTMNPWFRKSYKRSWSPQLVPRTRTLRSLSKIRRLRRSLITFAPCPSTRSCKRTLTRTSGPSLARRRT
jgi:elongation factor 3